MKMIFEQVKEWAFGNVPIEHNVEMTISLPADHWVFNLEPKLPEWAIDAGTD